MSEIDGIYSQSESMCIINELAKEFFMEDMLDQVMKNLSKGTLQKVGVIQAIMCHPAIFTQL